MTEKDRPYRHRMADQIRQDNLAILEYKGKRLDEKTKERFRRPAYSVGVRKEKKDENN